MADQPAGCRVFTEDIIYRWEGDIATGMRLLAGLGAEERRRRLDQLRVNISRFSLENEACKWRETLLSATAAWSADCVNRLGKKPRPRLNVTVAARMQRDGLHNLAAAFRSPQANSPKFAPSLTIQKTSGRSATRECYNFVYSILRLGTYRAESALFRRYLLIGPGLRKLK